MALITAGTFDGERPLHPAGMRVLLAAFERGWAHPDGLGEASSQSRHLLNSAREEIAAALGVMPGEVEFWGEPALISPMAILGAPIFSVMASLALTAFYFSSVELSAVSVEIYRMASAPTILTIPLFTFAGYVLAESKDHRLPIERKAEA